MTKAQVKALKRGHIIYVVYDDPTTREQLHPIVDRFVIEDIDERLVCTNKTTEYRAELLNPEWCRSMKDAKKRARVVALEWIVETEAYLKKLKEAHGV